MAREQPPHAGRKGRPVPLTSAPDGAKDGSPRRKWVRGDWTEQGAREVLQLARRYGTSILRNALALAAAMKIEDGRVGL